MKAMLKFMRTTLVGGVLFLVPIIAGVIANMDIYFQPTSLSVTLIMLAMLAAGLGLIVRGLRPHE